MSFKRLLSVMCFALFFLPSVSVFAQDGVIAGKVIDSKDATGLPGVTITVKGGTTSTTTSSDGSFKIKASNGATLVFTSVGFGAVEMTAANGMTVKMENKNAALNEVVVIGYGSARKRDLTGSIVNVSAKDFVKGPITTPEQLIAGKVAGVSIISNSGQPGVGSTIRIRGGSSLNASNNPLIVVDGVPLEDRGIAGSPNPLSLFNPNDIESFSILKDASAAAIYGSRAANGVILITTKKGSKGALRVSFSTLNALSVNASQVDVLNADQYRTVVRSKGTAGDIAALGSANTNWQDEIYRSAFMTDNNVSVSGGIKDIPYRLSLGYLNQDGVLKTSNLGRFTVGLNLSPRFLNDHLLVNVNVKYSNSKNVFANQGAIGSAINFDPTKPIRSGNANFGGYTEWLAGSTLNNLAPRNPVGLLDQRDDRSSVDRFLGSISLDYKFHFLPELRANLNLATDNASGSGNTFVPATAASNFNNGGSKTKYEETNNTKLLEFYLNYVKDLASINSKIDVMAGYSYQDNIVKAPTFAQLKADGSVFKPANPNPLEEQYTMLSFYGRLKYTYMDRLRLNVVVRRDGSSRFSPENRWGTFPSLSLSWDLMQESFMKDQNTITALSVRGGWGTVGQQEIGDKYGYIPAYFPGDSTALYQFGTQYVRVSRPRAYDVNLKWEETTTKNIALDLGIANNVNLTVEYFEKESKDLLATVPAPAGVNFSNFITTNIGSITNKGLEVAISATPVRKKDFTLDVAANLTYIIQNEITKLQLVNDPNFLGIDVGSSGFNPIQKQTVGYQPNSFFLYKQVYDNKGNPLEGVYEDRNRDSKVGESDKYWVRNPNAPLFMGFTANAVMGKWSAGFVLRGSVGGYVYNAVKANLGIYNQVITGQNYTNNASANLLTTGFNQRQTWSDYYLENASFLRADNIYVGYNFGSAFKGVIKNCRVNFNIQNAFVITQYSGLDPEILGGIDNTIYPRPRTFALGVNLDF
jgi:TonB-dependent starch-binding outer membrane protein SusC